MAQLELKEIDDFVEKISRTTFSSLVFFLTIFSSIVCSYLGFLLIIILS